MNEDQSKEIAALEEAVLIHDQLEWKRVCKPVEDAARRHLALLKAERDGLAKVVPTKTTEAMIEQSYNYERKLCGHDCRGLNHSTIYEQLLIAAPPFDYEGGE